MSLSQSNEQFQISLQRTEHGFSDYDVLGHPTLRRACVPLNIRRGESFNVYHGECSKSGATWLGNLEQSLAAWCLNELKEAVASAEAVPVSGIKIRVPELFSRADFQAYMNTNPVMTWHDKKGPIDPDSLADVAVFVDPSMTGEGTESDMPGWDLVVEKLKSEIGHGPFSGSHFVVILSNN